MGQVVAYVVSGTAAAGALTLVDTITHTAGSPAVIGSVVAGLKPHHEFRKVSPGLSPKCDVPGTGNSPAERAFGVGMSFGMAHHLGLPLVARWFWGVMTKSNTAPPTRADDDPVLAAIELTVNAWQRFVAGCACEPKDADGAPAILTPAYARWQAAQDDICQNWDGAYTAMLATPPTTAAGAAALIGAFLRYGRALGSNLEEVAPLLQGLLAYLEGREAA